MRHAEMPLPTLILLANVCASALALTLVPGLNTLGLPYAPPLTSVMVFATLSAILVVTLGTEEIVACPLKSRTVPCAGTPRPLFADGLETSR
jgi:hypothetical protein